MSITITHIPALGSIWVWDNGNPTYKPVHPRYAVVQEVVKLDGFPYSVRFKRISSFDDEVREYTWNLDTFYQYFRIIG